MQKNLLRLAISAAALIPAGSLIAPRAASATPIIPPCCTRFAPHLSASSGGDFSGVVVDGSLFQVNKSVRVELYDNNTGVPLNYTYVSTNSTGSFTWNDVPDSHLYCGENLNVRAYDTTLAEWVYTTGTAGCKIR